MVGNTPELCTETYTPELCMKKHTPELGMETYASTTVNFWLMQACSS